jgi:MFS family permease
MTGLNPSPRVVSAVQVATTLPMFLLALPAGALTDVVDVRKLLIVAQSAVAVVSIAFAAGVSARLATPLLVLAVSFSLGVAGALTAPAWLVTTPMLVPQSHLTSAVSLESSGYNVARAIGPAIAGVLIAHAGIEAPFWGYCAANLVVLVALIWWRAPKRTRAALPSERLISAMLAGVRYVRYSRDMDATLIRSVAFFPFASAYLALLPLVARPELGDGAEVYGALMGLIGLGSLVATFALGWLKRRFSSDWLTGLGTLGTVVALFLFASAGEPPLAFLGSFIAGASWIVALTTLSVAAQVALPEWVRGRGLAIFLTVFFGAMTAGSALWGEVANRKGLPFALAASGVCALAAMILTWRWKLPTGSTVDLTPSMHWRAPGFVRRVQDDRGPAIAIIEYQIDPKDSAAFLALMQDIGLERKRDGGYAWNVYEDPDQPGKIIETFLIHSVLELKYRQTRLTMADEAIEIRADAFLKAPQVARYLVASNPVHASRWQRVAPQPPA